MHRKSNNSDSVISLLAIVLIAIFAMPFLGIYFLVRENDSRRGLGLVLTILGIIIWIVIGVNSF